MRIALCLVTDLVKPLHTSLQTQPQPGPVTPLFAAAWLALNSCNQGGAVEARLVAIAWLCVGSCKFQARRRALRAALVLRDFRAGAAALRCSALHCATDTPFQEMIPVTELRNKGLRNKTRGARYRPSKNHGHLDLENADLCQLLCDIVFVVKAWNGWTRWGSTSCVKLCDQ